MGQGASSRKMAGETNRILVAGLYNSGKTTLMERLTGHSVAPRTGHPFEGAKYGNMMLTGWDLGGRDIMRPLYRYFFPMTDAIIYVMDSHERDQFHLDHAKMQLQRLVEEEELEGRPLLVLANKQDLSAAMTCLELRQHLDLGQVERERAVEILPLSLVTEQGLPEVVDWLERQQMQKEFQTRVVQPVQKAVPPSVSSACSRLLSTLKLAFRPVRKKLTMKS
ncbi:ADP-ribosylation factor-like protein 1 [Babylonia areolata]|uniref:ADP-ribosylation factor-like protein 1 n=1 Tax=Babylonia areolata TaxID=304850 RepID=UPI003FD32692